MINRTSETDIAENPPSFHAARQVFGTAMRPKQGLLHLPKSGDRQWPDLKCNKELDAEFARLFSTQLSGGGEVSSLHRARLEGNQTFG